MMFLALLDVAHAIEFRWYGIGPTFGTMAFPIRYPTFPGMVEGGVATVREDLSVGLRGLLYAGNDGRLFAHGKIGGNFSTWGQQEFTLGYDVLFVKDAELQFLGGLGLGYGHERYATDDKDAYPQFDIAYFPIRAEVVGLWRDKWRAYELQIYFTWHIVGEQRFFEDEDDGGTTGSDVPVTDALGLYMALGVEASVYFGNFHSKK